MSFDLYFCRENGSAPSVEELKNYFSVLPHFQLEEAESDAVEFRYLNEATGVYCFFSLSPLDAAELTGCGSSGLSFSLNFILQSNQIFSYQ